MKITRISMATMPVPPRPLAVMLLGLSVIAKLDRQFIGGRPHVLPRPRIIPEATSRLLTCLWMTAKNDLLRAFGQCIKSRARRFTPRKVFRRFSFCPTAAL